MKRRKPRRDPVPDPETIHAFCDPGPEADDTSERRRELERTLRRIRDLRANLATVGPDDVLDIAAFERVKRRAEDLEADVTAMLGQPEGRTWR